MDKKKLYQCKFCGYTSDDLSDFEPDKQNHVGYWCPDCDGFTYFDHINKQHRFRMIMETKDQGNEREWNTAYKFPYVSPLRYPGGKSRMTGYILSMCDEEHMEHFVEPFAGGASVGLSLLLSGKIQELYLNDMDYGVYSLFTVIKTCPWAITERIQSFTPSKEAYKKAQEIVLSHYNHVDMADAAWALLIVNRLAFSGIAKAGCLRDPLARWNGNTLIRRISRIHDFSDQLHISCVDACSIIEQMYWKEHTTIFIDPPYRNVGKDLYLHYYNDKEHDRLAMLLDELYKGFPGADMILTYNDDDYIKNLYWHPYIEYVQRKYSIVS